MGTNCAVFVANLFCFTYEYEFVDQLIEAQRVETLTHFTHTLRFVDDLLTANNPVFEKYLYTSQVDDAGIRGIYPDFLTLKCEQESDKEVSFLDVLIFRDTDVFMSKIYDKREHPPLSRVDQVKYPHPSCFLSTRSKLGIITSRFHAFGRICLRRVDFVERARIFLKEFLARGYSRSSVASMVKRFIRKVPLEFPVPKVGSFVKMLMP